VWPRGYAPSPDSPLSRKFLIFFHFKVVHSGAFSYSNSRVLFAIKCREIIIIIIIIIMPKFAKAAIAAFAALRHLHLHLKGTLSWYSWQLTVIQ